MLSTELIVSLLAVNYYVTACCSQSTVASSPASLDDNEGYSPHLPLEDCHLALVMGSTRSALTDMELNSEFRSLAGPEGTSSWCGSENCSLASWRTERRYWISSAAAAGG